ncbi:uncharacterized protein LOC130805042 [Amaranthus tricolor]|uniref:uncharacterized protein LOC130805042 n=1 Tax=Amaranthus tricolor TaxID=29722 RepID=UPI0025879FF7|nr:uncharacterized protein LOC130805042 [Amaranthus tricolor]
MEFGRRRENVNANGYGFFVHEYGNGNGNGKGNYNGNGLINSKNGFEDVGPILESFSSTLFPFSSSSSATTLSTPSSSSASPSRFIEHHVTKMDTLAGIAIRYGVEVADIKKLNGLVTDLQMFALKTLHIPLPGRHPPSTCVLNGYSSSGPSNSERTIIRRAHTEILESFQSSKITPQRISPAMSSLRGYYGLGEQKNVSEGFEMVLYNRRTTSYSEEGYSTPSLINASLSQHRRSRSVANGVKIQDGELDNDVDGAAKWIHNLNKRRQKSESDFSRTLEKVLKEENGSGSWFSAITGKGLALRTKASSKTNSASEVEAGGTYGFPFSLRDSTPAENTCGVRKSSSTSSLLDQEGNNNTSSIWSAAKWSLTPDLQAALAKPIFEGLPKPITGRKSKAALD